MRFFVFLFVISSSVDSQATMQNLHLLTGHYKDLHAQDHISHKNEIVTKRTLLSLLFILICGGLLFSYHQDLMQLLQRFFDTKDHSALQISQKNFEHMQKMIISLQTDQQELVQNMKMQREAFHQKEQYFEEREKQYQKILSGVPISRKESFSTQEFLRNTSTAFFSLSGFYQIALVGSLIGIVYIIKSFNGFTLLKDAAMGIITSFYGGGYVKKTVIESMINESHKIPTATINEISRVQRDNHTNITNEIVNIKNSITEVNNKLEPYITNNEKLETFLKQVPQLIEKVAEVGKVQKQIQDIFKGMNNQNKRLEALEGSPKKSNQTNSSKNKKNTNWKNNSNGSIILQCPNSMNGSNGHQGPRVTPYDSNKDENNYDFERFIN